ncbi:MAG TPA: sigma-70 family RNA polymerase sigma factor [Ktedonobacterales bacterium]|nr:sigma-70 family RNA polymerase sigma factor [Ktedonobacterales bacterium]
MQDGWDDDALWRGLVARNTRAMEALVSRYSRELTYFVRSLLGGVATAQDVEECVSDVFVVAWKEAGDFDPARGAFRTWLTMRAKYLALDTRRQVQRRQALLIPTPSAANDDHASHDIGQASAEGDQAEGRPGTLDPAESIDGLLERRERQAELRAALEELPELDRLLVYLRYFRLATTEEIAVRTGLTHRAIDTRLWRSRKQLRDVLEKLEERARAGSRERSKQLARPTVN